MFWLLVLHERKLFGAAPVLPSSFCCSSFARRRESVLPTIFDVFWKTELAARLEGRTWCIVWTLTSVQTDKSKKGNKIYSRLACLLVKKLYNPAKSSTVKPYPWWKYPFMSFHSLPDHVALSPSDIRLDARHPLVDTPSSPSAQCPGSSECADRGRGYIRHDMLGVIEVMGRHPHSEHIAIGLA